MRPFSSRCSLVLGSLVAAAMLAACGGGSQAPSSASTPTPTQSSAALKNGAAPGADADVTSTPVDSDRGNRASARTNNKIWIVQLAESPVTAYGGEIQGLAATKPRKGQKIDPNAPAVTNYMAYLAGRHDAVLQAAGNGRKLYSYGYVFNGFAAELTDAQAQQLAQAKGVLAVSKDELRQLDTASTPAFLGLSGTSGVWSTTGAKGEGVVIGIVDSGIWPESDSFTDRTGSFWLQSSPVNCAPGTQRPCQPGSCW
jgi:hypothetical protein